MNVKTSARAGLLVLSLCIGQAALAQTDTPEARREAAVALIKSIDDLMGPERMAQMIKGSMRAPMVQALQGHPTLSPAQKERAAQVFTEEMDPVMAEMFKQMMPGMYAAMTQLYAERLTVSEIQELQRMYASPTMRKATVMAMEDMPRFMQPAMQSMGDMAQKFQGVAQRASERLRAEGIHLDPPPQQQERKPASGKAPAQTPPAKQK